MEKRKHIEELYYIRAIAALGILIIHATGGFAVSSEFNSNAMYLGIFANQFFRFGSPIFMMISGLVLFYNYRSMEEFDSKGFYKKKFLYIIIPYIIWSAIYFFYLNNRGNIPFSREQIIILLRKILDGTAFNHLYFMTLILQFYILLPIFIKFLTGPMKRNPIKLFFTLFLLQGIVLIYGRYFKNPNAEGLVKLFNNNYWKSVFGWFFYFLSGGILGIHYHKIVDYIEKNIRYILPIYLLITMFYVGSVYHNIWKISGRDYYDSFGSIRPETMIYGIITMPILIWLTRRMVGGFKGLKSFGTYSLGIYFAHPIVLEVLKIRVFARYPHILGYSRISSMFILIFLGLVITFGLVLTIAMLKYRWVLLGRIPRFRISQKGKELKVKVNS